jgi:hypothetical protein
MGVWTAEMERLYGDRLGATAFERAEIRRTSRRRNLSCGHAIDAREPYRYYVAKLIGIDGLLQVLQCDTCMRSGNRY